MSEINSPTILKMVEDLRQRSFELSRRLGCVNDAISSVPEENGEGKGFGGNDLLSAIQGATSNLNALDAEMGRLERIIGVCPPEFAAPPDSMQAFPVKSRR